MVSKKQHEDELEKGLALARGGMKHTEIGPELGRSKSWFTKSAKRAGINIEQQNFTVRVSFTCFEDQKAKWIEQAAADDFVSLSEWIRNLCDERVAQAQAAKT